MPGNTQAALLTSERGQMLPYESLVKTLSGMWGGQDAKWDVGGGMGNGALCMVPLQKTSGWWFGTCFIFHFIYGMSSFPLIFKTTNQTWFREVLVALSSGFS